jgi:hypothetical protein
VPGAGTRRWERRRPPGAATSMAEQKTRTRCSRKLHGMDAVENPHPTRRHGRSRVGAGWSSRPTKGRSARRWKLWDARLRAGERRAALEKKSSEDARHLTEP